MDAKASHACGSFFIEKNMSQPNTHWIRDNGTVLTETTSVLIDESANFFVDENANNLLDSQSSDGVKPKTIWADE